MAMIPMKKNIETKPNLIKQFEYLYSPRTNQATRLEEEDKLFNDLSIGFDPITIKIIKKHFKERLGVLSKNDFIGILKNHLLSWHPDLPDREKILIKLLAKLFSAIDLNDNGTMEWDEFTNYIINSSNGSSKDDLSYRLRYYYFAKDNINDTDFTDNVTFAFFVEKYNFIGIVLEGKSQIMFYDGITCKRLKMTIELKDTQREIDELEIKELNLKAVELLKNEEEEKKKKIKKQEERKKLKEEKQKILVTDPETQSGRKKMQRQGIFSKNNKQKKYDKESTPEKLKKELHRIKLEPEFHLKKDLNKKFTVLTSIFIPEYDTLLVSSTNNKISAWKYSSGEFKNINNTTSSSIEKDSLKCIILTTDVPQYTLAWDPIQKHLYSGQADGKILKWDLTKSRNIENETFDITRARIRRNKERKRISESDSNSPITIKSIDKEKNENQSKAKGVVKAECFNRDTVSCIIILGKLQLIAAGYYNGNIILWDIVLKDYRKYYSDQETGIYQIVYDSSKNLIFSCGFDHNIFIYDPYIDGSAVYKLIGHNWSINSISLNERDSELVSLDILGNIKIWDSNAFYNFQTINLNEILNIKGISQLEINKNKKKISSNLRMIYLTKIKKILIYGEKLLLFETDRATNPDLADDQLVFGCLYQPHTYELITVCLNKIKIWGIFDGKVKKIYDDPMKNEITTFTLDDSKKRIYIGDNVGKVKNFNMSNGNLIKEFVAHTSEIVHICHSTKHEILITCSINQIIRIHSDKELLTTEVLKELSFNLGIVKSINILDTLSRVVFGISSGAIKFYDIDHYRFDSEGENDLDKQFTQDEVSNIKEIPNTELIFVAHESGKCRLVVAPPSGFKYTSFGLFTNIVIKDEVTQAGILLSVDYDKERNLLYTGDQFGFIKCFDLSDIVNIIAKDAELKVTMNNIYRIEKCQIKEVWCVYAHKESIKHIHFAILSPRVIVSTGNDLRVKIINAENGQIIDELKQISSKFNPVPIGIKYYIADPLVSKKPKDQIDESNIIWRKDLEKNPASSIQKYAHLPSILNYYSLVYDYSRKITEINAKDKLWQLIKGKSIEMNKSTSWQYEIDLNEINKIEENEFEIIYTLIKAKEQDIKRTELAMQHNSIFSDNYRPLFIEDMNEEKLKEFSLVLSNKLRYIKLSMAKIELNHQKYTNFREKEKEKERKSVAQSQIVKPSKKLLKPLKTLNSNKISKSEYAYLPQKDLTPSENFERYKEDFNAKLQEISVPIEELLRKKKQFLLPKICKTEGNQ